MNELAEAKSSFRIIIKKDVESILRGASLIKTLSEKEKVLSVKVQDESAFKGLIGRIADAESTILVGFEKEGFFSFREEDEMNAIFSEKRLVLNALNGAASFSESAGISFPGVECLSTPKAVQFLLERESFKDMPVSEYSKEELSRLLEMLATRIGTEKEHLVAEERIFTAEDKELSYSDVKRIVSKFVELNKPELAISLLLKDPYALSQATAIMNAYRKSLFEELSELGKEDDFFVYSKRNVFSKEFFRDLAFFLRMYKGRSYFFSAKNCSGIYHAIKVPQEKREAIFRQLSSYSERCNAEGVRLSLEDDMVFAFSEKEISEEIKSIAEKHILERAEALHLQ